MNYTREIDLYLAGNLKDKELEDFEHQMRANPELKENVEEFRKLHDGMKEISGHIDISPDASEYDDESAPEFENLTFEEKVKLYEEIDEMLNHSSDPLNEEQSRELSEFKSILADVRQTYDSPEVFEENTISDRRRVWYRIAAAIVLLIAGALTILLLTNQTKSNQELFSEYYSPYEKNLNYRTNDEGSDIVNQAFESYLQHDYNKALLLFQQVSEDQLDANTLKFYMATTLLETGDIAGAIANFQSIVDSPDSVLKLRAQWYLALCFLKQNNTEESIKLFTVLSSSDNSYKSQALDILKEMNQSEPE